MLQAARPARPHSYFVFNNNNNNNRRRGERASGRSEAGGHDERYGTREAIELSPQCRLGVEAHKSEGSGRSEAGGRRAGRRANRNHSHKSRAAAILVVTVAVTSIAVATTTTTTIAISQSQPQSQSQIARTRAAPTADNSGRHQGQPPRRQGEAASAPAAGCMAPLGATEPRIYTAAAVGCRGSIH